MNDNLDTQTNPNTKSDVLTEEALASSAFQKTVVSSSDKKDGQNKCPRCGATDIAFNEQTGRLRCNSCRYEFEHDKFVKSVTDISALEGVIVGSGAQNIEADTDDMLTFKCDSCAAEVVVDTSESLQARCHWCRNTLSVNQQIPNGAVPDKVLPFSVKKDDAQGAIAKFVGDRQTFAHPKFKAEFTADNVMGVYLPYMVVDVNAKSKLLGQGEVLIRRWTETTGSGKNQTTTTYYDADLYDIEREFDLIVEGLAIEANAEKLQYDSSSRTNNVVNAIRPFDTENSVKWDPNFMKGFTSQKRDTNVEELSAHIDVKCGDIARHQANITTTGYDRGVRWEHENLDIKGSQWKAAYLPIWLYSYQMTKNSGDAGMIHYVAVNGRNLKTMGSVPINWGKLWLWTIIVTIISTILGLTFGFMWLHPDDAPLAATSGLAGPLFFWLTYSKYRNKGARFNHETGANSQILNLQQTDDIKRRIRRTTRNQINGRNESTVNYKGKV